MTTMSIPDDFWPAKLAEVAKQVGAGEQPMEKVRTLLSWFNSERRGQRIISMIRRRLEYLNLVTEPNFEYSYIDGYITFKTPEAAVSKAEPPAVPVLADPSAVAPSSAVAGDSPVVEMPTVYEAGEDPAYRVGRLPSANKEVVSVAPESELAVATTLMLRYDFSQLPIINGRTVKGMISWKSIGSRIVLGTNPQFVREAMDKHYEISDDLSIFRAIPVVIEQECVLVRNRENQVCGLITTSDLSQQFGQLGEPFLLLSEIENQIRVILDGKFSKEELAKVADPGDAGRPIEDVSDLNFGGYLRLVENPENWDKIGLKIDRATFVKGLDEVRLIRNDVMHFDPDGIADSELASIRQFRGFLERIREVRPKV